MRKETGVSESQGRLERIAKIRDQIKRGVYETPAKIEATVDRLLKVVAEGVVLGA